MKNVGTRKPRRIVRAKIAKVKAEKFPPEAFDAVPRVALVLTDETLYLTRFDERGMPISSYPVRAQDAASAFQPLGASTGILPTDVLFWQSRKGVDRIGLWLPPAVRDLLFAQGRRDVVLSVPLPGFVFIGAGTQYHIFAATARPTKPSDKLYRAPLPNVHPDGNICVGNVKFPKASAGTMASAAALFFESHFNSDLSADKVRSGCVESEDDEDYDDGNAIAEDDIQNLVREPEAASRQPISLYRFLSELEGKRTFPLDELVPSGTMGQVMGGKHENT